MSTSPSTEPEPDVAAVSVEVTADRLRIGLSDGRVLDVELARVPWLRWLREASEADRGGWSIEPGGFAVYWESLDDGVEIRHLLSPHPLAAVG